MMERQYTVDGVLGSRHEMDALIHSLARMNLDNATGGSYCRVCLAYFERGVLLESEHRNDDRCSICIVSDPSAHCVRGDQNSRYSGNPRPKPSVGQWVGVWSSGTWAKRGPWEPVIREVIQSAIAKLEAARAAKADKDRKAMEARVAAAEKRDDDLLAAWGSNAPIPEDAS